jgi:hypothetical protein
LSHDGILDLIWNFVPRIALNLENVSRFNFVLLEDSRRAKGWIVEAELFLVTILNTGATSLVHLPRYAILVVQLTREQWRAFEMHLLSRSDG